MEDKEENKLNTEAASEIKEDTPAEPEQTVAADLNGDGVVDKDEAEIDEALKSLEGEPVEAPKKKKHAWLGYVLLVGVICLSVWAMLEIVRTNDPNDFQSFGEIIAASDWRFALITLAVLIVIVACICLEYVVVIKATTGKTRIRTGMKVALLGKFYDNVTPFGTGGQPMQIYYLHKKGLSGGASSAVVLTKYFVWMICWLFISLLLMACNTHVLGGLDDATRIVLLVTGWVGMGINVFLPLSILLFAVVPKFANKLASFVVGLGYKVKIVKDKEKTLAKATKVVSDFRTTFKIISKRPLLFITLIILCIVEIFLNFSLPYFFMRTFSGLSSSGAAGDFSTLIAVTAINVYVAFGVSFIPTPGNTGAMEGMGALAFKMFVTSGAVQFWSMFGWRFATYYIYILIGLCLVIFDLIRKIYRARKNRKNVLNSSTEDSPKNIENEET